jgi:hypothetical protein
MTMHNVQRLKMPIAIRYKIATERSQIVIRSHDFHFLHHLVDFLEGNPIHPAFAEEIKIFARYFREVLDGKFGAFTQEL